MSVVPACRRSLSSLLLAGALAGALACSAGPTQIGDPSPTAQSLVGQGGPIAQTPHRPHITVLLGLDVTLSYPRADTLAADRIVADWLDEAVQSSQDGVTAYVTLINSHSYDPSSTVQVIVIPPTSADPAPPTLAPLPAPTGNPYVDGQRRAQVQAQNAQATHGYQEALAAQQTRLAAVRRQVRAQTDRLRALDPPQDDRTDVWGMLQRASERLGGEPGIKVLVIASDLENNTMQDYGPHLALGGVIVRVVNYECSLAPECASKTQRWQSTFSAAGARDIGFLDPAQTVTLPSPLPGQGVGQEGASA